MAGICIQGSERRLGEEPNTRLNMICVYTLTTGLTPGWKQSLKRLDEKTGPGSWTTQTADELSDEKNGEGRNFADKRQFIYLFVGFFFIDFKNWDLAHKTLHMNANVPGISEMAAISPPLQTSSRRGFRDSHLPPHCRHRRRESNLHANSNLTKSSFPLGKLNRAN